MPSRCLYLAGQLTNVAVVTSRSTWSPDRSGSWSSWIEMFISFLWVLPLVSIKSIFPVRACSLVTCGVKCMCICVGLWPQAPWSWTFCVLSLGAPVLLPDVYSVDLEVSRVSDPDVLQCPTCCETKPWLEKTNVLESG